MNLTHLRYHLKRVAYRKFFYLSDYEYEITMAIKKAFPYSEVYVYDHYFEIYDSIDGLDNKSQLQQMGRLISCHCFALRSLVERYGSSRQLFTRIK